MSRKSAWARDRLVTVTKADTSGPAVGMPGEALSAPSVRRYHERRDKRDRYILKGPVSFAWVRDNIPDRTSRLVLVARAFMDMARSDECVLTDKVWNCAGISDRYERRRSRIANG